MNGKRLIEVAFPLKQTSIDSVHEKNVRHGHISTLHISKPHLARAAGLGDCPGFDLHSKHRNGEERAIEVKGRARVGEIELTEKEWARACNERGRYWLYVVFDCGTAAPRLFPVRDPFGSLVVGAIGGVLVQSQAIIVAAGQVGGA